MKNFVYISHVLLVQPVFILDRRDVHPVLLSYDSVFGDSVGRRDDFRNARVSLYESARR